MLKGNASLWGLQNILTINVTVYDKTSTVTLHPAKTQITLGIRLVWSEFLLCAEWEAKDPSFLMNLIGLGGCPGFSESSLGSGHNINCWFFSLTHLWLNTSYSIGKTPCVSSLSHPCDLLNQSTWPAYPIHVICLPNPHDLLIPSMWLQIFTI